MAWISRTRSSSNSSYLVSSSSALNSDGSKNLHQQGETRTVLHDVEEFANVILEGCPGENDPLPDLERTQLFEKFTLIILQRLSLIHNQTFPRILSQKRDVCPCGAVPCNHHVCLEIQHRFRSAKFVRFLPELIRSEVRVCGCGTTRSRPSAVPGRATTRSEGAHFLNSRLQFSSVEFGAMTRNGQRRYSVKMVAIMAII
jgi:hypothetical protein